MDLIPYLVHEQQEGQLCAQHALNNLLQGTYYTAIDLSSIARELDESENSVLEGNRKGASENYDDSGFFSVQVLQKALETWNLTLEPIGSEAQKEVKADPAKADAFILNLSEHWFTIRRFGGSRQRFMNLNSLLGAPEPVTETYLSVLLNALEGEGYSVFVVVGKLPTCDADSFAARNPVPPAREPTAGTKAPAGPQAFAGKGYSLSGSGSDSDIALATALSMDGEDELQRAILMSMKESAAPTADEIRRKRLERFGG